MATRRWFYFIPSRGEPRKLVHRIESHMLDGVPGKKTEYSGWEELHKSLPRLLKGGKTIAMQYSPMNDIPYIGLVDAGTIELVRRSGKKVVSSADLVQKFEAAWSDEQLEGHLAAGKIIDRIVHHAFAHAGAAVREKKQITEYDLRQWILEQFAANGLETEDPPVAAVGPSSGDPHYAPPASGSRTIRAGDLLLLDVWGNSRSREASITTRPGWVIWADRCPRNIQRSSKW